MRLLVLKFLVLLSVLLITACSDLDRTNPLDPQNPKSKRIETVLIESFVNESGGDVINSSTNALERLLREYGNESFIYLEHHIEKTPGTDPWALDASLSRYLSLVPQSAEQAIPDILFNGNQGRVQGASDEEAAYLRYKTVLENELARQSTFTIEPKAEINGNRILLSADIAKLGSTNASDVIVITALLETVSNSIRKIVRAWSTAKTIGNMDHGEIVSIEKQIDIQPDWDTSRLTAVIIIHNSQTFQVFQSSSVLLY